MGMKIVIRPQIVEKFMIENGMSLKEFSRESTVCQPTLRRAIKGENITVGTANKLLKYMNVPVEKLVDIIDE